MYAGGELCQWSVSIVNMGLWGRIHGDSSDSPSVGTSKWPPWQPFGKPTSRCVLCTNDRSGDIPVNCSGDLPAVF